LTPASAPRQEEDSITPNPIVESPTGIQSAHSFTDSVDPTTVSPNSTLQPPRTAESDAVSIRSTTNRIGSGNTPSKGNSDLFTTPLPTPKKKRTWRRNSQSRKPTGLASAIAASGLAMVSPAMSPPIPILSPQIPNGIQRTTTQQSSTGSVSRTRTSLDLPDNSPHRRRPSASVSVSIHSENNSEIYSDDRGEYSGVEGNSTDGNGSGSEDDLMDLELTEDDIPVTGFAVASNKRNADFHELFPNIPEGDYLIEGEQMSSLRISITDYNGRLWVCVAEGNTHSRPDIHFRKPHMLSCQYLWLDNRREPSL
jgi:hypothetical protein